MGVAALAWTWAQPVVYFKNKVNNDDDDEEEEEEEEDDEEEE